MLARGASCAEQVTIYTVLRVPDGTYAIQFCIGTSENVICNRLLIKLWNLNIVSTDICGITNLL